MKHKVSELTGAPLDAAVAMAEGIPGDIRDWGDSRGSVFQAKSGHLLRYSTDWRDGGPIIERERITVQASQAGDWRAFKGDGTTNAGTGRGPREPLAEGRGDAALTAARRAYVASKFGEEVELP